MEVPIAIPGDGEALVKIEFAGICGSDMHAWHGHDSRRVPPLILGHEGCGIVEHGKFYGKRVVLNPLIHCNKCEDCLCGRSNLCPNRTMIGMNRPGCFADYVTIPEQNLLPVPGDMSPVNASLTEPAATTVHAIKMIRRALHQPIQEGPVLVIGAGAIGLLSALFLRHLGCADITIVDTNSKRLNTAVDVGIEKTINPTIVQAEENHYKVVIDAVGSGKTRESAVKAVRHGGVIMHIGLQESKGVLDVRRLTLAEITFMGSYTYTEHDLKETIDHLYSGNFGDLSWVEKRSITCGNQAFVDIHNHNVSSGKILLIPE